MFVFQVSTLVVAIVKSLRADAYVMEIEEPSLASASWNLRPLTGALGRVAPAVDGKEEEEAEDGVEVVGLVGDDDGEPLGVTGVDDEGETETEWEGAELEGGCHDLKYL